MPQLTLLRRYPASLNLLSNLETRITTNGDIRITTDGAERSTAASIELTAPRLTLLRAA